jgi:two-component system osmolarity sensor histidine kinase EnvZ
MSRADQFIKKFLPRSLLGRSLMILIVPILLVQIIAAYTFFERHWDKMTSRLGYAVAGEIMMIAKTIDKDPDPQTIARVTGYAAENLGLFVEFRAGEALPTEASNYGRALIHSSAVRLLERELDNQAIDEVVVQADSSEKWVRVRMQMKNGIIDVAVPERRFFSSSSYIFLLWVMGSSIVLLSISVIFMRNQIRPIRKLAAAADRLGKGREVPFFKPEGASEVRQAGRAFLDMHERIRRQIEQRTTMLAGVSHDLRTPLTRLKLQMAMLGDSPDVEAMKQDVSQMEKMIAGYLDFVRGGSSEQVALTNLNQMIDHVVTSAKRQGIEVSAHVTREINVMLKPVAFERCLMNVVSNAGKYARHVWISADAIEGDIQIVVDDDGPGIPEDKYEEVFKPFYRVDTSRNASTGGVGLGLPIAMDIVHAHGGHIWLERSPRGGLRVNITVPI